MWRAGIPQVLPKATRWELGTCCHLRWHLPGQHTRSLFMKLLLKNKNKKKKRKGERRAYWKVFWLVLDMQAVLAVSAKARIWDKYLLGIVIINITATDVSFPQRIIYWALLFTISWASQKQLLHKMREWHCRLCRKALSTRIDYL